MNKSIDIIIPIYNALDYLKLAVQSVLQKDAGHPFHLYLINDCSPDPEISKYLKTITDKRVTVLENAENLGFSGTCNRGMQLSKSDVILLNSDTEVTEGWLGKIVACAYSHPKIGTVSPHTNSGAGLLNIPDFYQRSNPLPEGYDLDNWARVYNEISLYSYPRSLTNVGYCLFIKRDLLNQIGYLDKETFGRGYGEETDLCLRAHEAGWLNVNDDSSFIQHEGKSASFTSAEAEVKRETLVKHAEEVINKRYPYVRKWLDEKLEEGPTTPMHKNWWFHQDFFSSKKRIMHVVYNPVDVQWGGIEVLTKQITSQIDEFDHYIVHINKDSIDITRVWENWDKKKTLSIPGPFRIDAYKLENPKLTNAFEEVVKLINPGIVHFQSVHKLPVDILSVPRKLNRFSIVTIHDFSLFCPAYWDVDAKGGIQNSINRICERFSDAKIVEKEKAYYTKRDTLVRENLAHIDAIVAPSAFVKDLLLQDYPEFKHSIQLIENGIAKQPQKSAAEKSKKIEKLTIGFVGTGSKLKGADIFLEIIKQDKSEQFNWKFIGPLVDEDLKNEYSKISNITIVGEYKSEELYTHLDDVDIVLMPSKVAETYSLILSEILTQGIHVISSDIGAIPYRLKEQKVGESYSLRNYHEEVWKRLQYLAKNTSELKVAKRSAAAITPRLAEEMVSEFTALYKKNISDYLQFSVEEKRVLNAKRVKYIIFSQRKWERSTMSRKRRAFMRLNDAISDTLRSTPFHKPLKKAFKKVKRVIMR